MLTVNEVDAGYGAAKVLHGLSLDVCAGEIHCLLGRNGAGKTTTMKAIMGLIEPSAGSIMLDGTELSRLPAHEVPRHGVGYVPQGRRLFSELTVRENLEIGLAVRGHGRAKLEQMLTIFPRLAERLTQRAETLSGGEQQMLATARALCVEPKLLLLDEPTEGLQPSMIEQIRKVIVRMKADGVAVLLVEQRVDAVLAIADRVTFIENGRRRECIDASALRADHGLLTKYVGV